MINGSITEPASAGGQDAFDRAMALFDGRCTRDDFARALDLLRNASSAGIGAASERLAVLAAMGVAAAPDWDRALDLLTLAGKQGDAKAAQQLQILRHPGEDPDLEGTAAVEDDQPGIDIASRLRPTAAAEVRSDPLIRSYPNFATPAECRWLSAAVEPRLKRATVFDRSSGAAVEDSTRSNRYVTFPMGELDFLAEVFRARISAATRLPTAFFEPPQIFCYRVGEQFELHSDFLDPDLPGHREEIARAGQRVGTFLVYLNDDYDGGSTAFPALDLEWRGGTGDGLFFANVDRHGRPHRGTFHAGKPPTRGEKWVFSQWIRDRLPIA